MAPLFLWALVAMASGCKLTKMPGHGADAGAAFLLPEQEGAEGDDIDPAFFRQVDAAVPSDTMPSEAGASDGGVGPTGEILWQSTAWSNGKVREIQAAHDFDPDDPKVELAAGEGRKLTFHGDGTVTLEGNRSRIYIHGNHRDAELVFEANATDSKLENISTKLRSRHNEEGSAENRFGGYGVAFDLKGQSADFQIELYHNEHEGGVAHKLARPLEYNHWYRYRVTIESAVGDKKAVVRAFIDYDLNGSWTEVGSETYERKGYLLNDLNALYCWIRANSGNATQTGLQLRNAWFATLPAPAPAAPAH